MIVLATYVQTELEDGVSKEDVMRMLSEINDEGEITTHAVFTDNTTAHGFIDLREMNEISADEGEISDFVKKIIGDMNNENESGVYEFKAGRSIVIKYRIS